MSLLLEGRPEPWIGEPAEDVRSFDESDFQGFEVVQDSRIFDLRSWKPAKARESDPSSSVFCYRRLKVYKQSEEAPKNLFHLDLLATSPSTAVRFPRQQLEPKLSMSRSEGLTHGQKEYRWRATYDFQQVPAGEFVDLMVEYHSPGHYLQRGGNGTAMVFPVHADTAELTTWILMPERKEYQGFHIIRYATGKPEKVEAVRVVTEYLPEDFTIIAFKLLSLKAGYTYEVSWTYR
jgi:hypothetical protein